MQTADFAPTLPKQDYLHHVEIFADLNADELNVLRPYIRTHHFQAGHILHTPEQTPESVFILHSGSVRIYCLSPEGKMIIVGVKNAGDIFGEMTLLGQSLYRNYAETATDATVSIMRKDDVEQLMLSDVRITRRLIQSLATRINHLEYQLSVLALKPVPQRIVAVLLLLKRQLNERPEEYPIVVVTHEELAHMIGATRENVTKVLNHLQDRGVIELRRGQIKLLAVEQIETNCGSGLV